MEFLKKVTSEQGSSIAEIRKKVSGMDRIRELLAKFMKKQGISLYSPEEEIENRKVIEGHSEGGGSKDEDINLRSGTKKVELPSIEGVDSLGWYMVHTRRMEARIETCEHGFDDWGRSRDDDRRERQELKRISEEEKAENRRQFGENRKQLEAILALLQRNSHSNSKHDSDGDHGGRGNQSEGEQMAKARNSVW